MMRVLVSKQMTVDALSVMLSIAHDININC